MNFETEKVVVAFMNLGTIQSAVNDGLLEASGHYWLFDGEPINWGDLSCVSAEIVIDMDGNVRTRIVIEEASPECPKLCSWVEDYLTKRDFESFEVMTAY